MSIAVIRGGVQEDVVISKFYETLCFDLLIKDNNVEITELIISILSWSVKSKDIHDLKIALD